MIKKPNQSIIRKITRALSILANENQTEVKFVKFVYTMKSVRNLLVNMWLFQSFTWF